MHLAYSSSWTVKLSLSIRNLATMSSTSPPYQRNLPVESSNFDFHGCYLVIITDDLQQPAVKVLEKTHAQIAEENVTTYLIEKDVGDELANIMEATHMSKLPSGTTSICYAVVTAASEHVLGRLEADALHPARHDANAVPRKHGIGHLGNKTNVSSEELNKYEQKRFELDGKNCDMLNGKGGRIIANRSFDDKTELTPDWARRFIRSCLSSHQMNLLEPGTVLLQTQDGMWQGQRGLENLTIDGEVHKGYPIMVFYC